jgi:hypothetical protein
MRSCERLDDELNINALDTSVVDNESGRWNSELTLAYSCLLVFCITG